jgi:hypothetical protein
VVPLRPSSVGLVSAGGGVLGGLRFSAGLSRSGPSVVGVLGCFSSSGSGPSSAAFLPLPSLLPAPLARRPPHLGHLPLTISYSATFTRLQG